MAERAKDYSLVYDVVALAPSFGRTRGVLRGAAGYSLVWPACRTRASLAEARVAEAKARRAWRASETSLELLRVDCERLRGFTKVMEELRALVARVRHVKDAALVQGEPVQDERGLEHVARVVATGADILAMLLKQACAGLDHFY
eukprot:SAG11_NODE_1462_length_4866_cov_4.910216_1_plen_144_part_10